MSDQYDPNAPKTVQPATAIQQSFNYIEKTRARLGEEIDQLLHLLPSLEALFGDVIEPEAPMCESEVKADGRRDLNTPPRPSVPMVAKLSSIEYFIEGQAQRVSDARAKIQSMIDRCQL